ncbi:hypothetical protein [Streptomyces rubiginosohelvolus]|uniref:hypothetical protein n=1 Tax=Streptomyces rubiginosohelvolus TaxID=67362 RepID=UPI0037222635
MTDQIETTDIQSRYRKQYADDLAANRQKQGDLTAQIAGLQEDLEQLRAEEAWLTQAQDTLPGTAGPGETASGPAATTAQAEREPTAEAPQTVPAQRHDEEAEQATRSGQASTRTPAKKRAAKKTAAGKKTAASGKSTSRAGRNAPAKRTAAKSWAVQAPAAAGPDDSPAGKAAPQKGPVLWQLVLDILHQTPGQPCVAREVTEQLAREHPGRATSVQMVRNSLEILVKKGLAEKTQQQRSVMYTATPHTPAEPADDASRSSEPEQAEGTEAESGKVAAGV